MVYTKNYGPPSRNWIHQAAWYRLTGAFNENFLGVAVPQIWIHLVIPYLDHSLDQPWLVTLVNGVPSNYPMGERYRV
jgi:hypothetical protein